MLTRSATAISCSNIAFIKYWGDLDPHLHIPANGSLSMNLDGLFSRASVTFGPELKCDQLTLNEATVAGAALARVSVFLDWVRQMAGLSLFAAVESSNNFPMGAGIASSASAFAALALAASTAAGLHLAEKDLSRLARRGSGSACRSIPTGFVEWNAGSNDADSYAASIASPDYWELTDCIAIVSQVHKSVGSAEGHAVASTSPLQACRVAETPRRLELCRRAIRTRDFEALAAIVELDSNLMHAVMLTSDPPLHYWRPATLAIMGAVTDWRIHGAPVCYTVDAGPNVHVLCLSQVAPQVASWLTQIPGVLQVLTARAGKAAWLETSDHNRL